MYKLPLLLACAGVCSSYNLELGNAYWKHYPVEVGAYKSKGENCFLVMNSKSESARFECDQDSYNEFAFVVNDQGTFQITKDDQTLFITDGDTNITTFTIIQNDDTFKIYT